MHANTCTIPLNDRYNEYKECVVATEVWIPKNVMQLERFHSHLTMQCIDRYNFFSFISIRCDAM